MSPSDPGFKFRTRTLRLECESDLTKERFTLLVAKEDIRMLAAMIEEAEKCVKDGYGDGY